MKIAVPRQTNDGETRAPLIPAVVKKLIALGAEVVVESGVGVTAGIRDEDFEAAGATIAPPSDGVNAAIWSQSDVVVTLEPPAPEAARSMQQGAALIGLLDPQTNIKLVKALADAQVTAFSMEFLPRISRSQSMDVLSSQANISGYKSVILAAERCPKMFPMMITAAGTIAPAKVFVLGAGVAGLQAIATAKRLGAVVEAFDVRAVTKEQVQSLGARFIELPTTAQDDKTTGGYAKEQSDEERRKQAALMSKHVIGADVSITTAAVFAKAPPMLIPGAVVEQMHAGSIIVDIAASPEHGRGNCELTKPGEVVTTKNGVTIVGLVELPRLLPVHASQVYANNMLAFLSELIQEKKLALNMEDEVQNGTAITHGGEITNELVKQAIGSAAPA